MRLPSPALLSPLLAALLAPAAAAQSVTLERLVGGLDRPLGLEAAGDGSGRLFVLEQRGRIRIVAGGSLRAEPFLDITDRVGCCGEQGLLGLAFHPRYAENGLFFVNYTERGGDTVISRFSVSADPDRADAGSELEVLSYEQPFANHNGGQLAFGPDGYLYVGSGDGGGAGDPGNRAQDLGSLLGKILRLDVEGSPYAIPSDNPFASDPQARPEIWAYGLRNPWRFSFDRSTGDLYIGDVGQAAREEIDFQPAASGGGENYGWRRMEGSLCFDPPSGCNDGTLVLPVAEYGHDEGCSVTGGYVARGAGAAGLLGLYLYGDFCSGRLWGLARGGGVWESELLAETGLAISSFGEDEEGELYVVHYAPGDGAVYRLESPALFRDGFESGSTAAWRRTEGEVEVVAPGLRGTAFALEAPAAGSPEPAFVLTRRGRGGRSLTVDFLLSANGVEAGGATLDAVEIRGRGRLLAGVAVERRARYRALLRLGGPGGGETVGSVRIPRRRAVRLTLEWKAASDPDAADGFARLSKRGRPVVEAAGLANGRARVRSVRAGLPQGSAGAAGGSILLDEFTISR